MVKTGKTLFLGGGKNTMPDDERIALYREMHHELLMQSQDVWVIYLTTREPAAKELSSQLWGASSDWFQEMLGVHDARIAREEIAKQLMDAELSEVVQA